MLAAVYLYLAIVSIDTEEISTGEKHLEKCKEIIDKFETKPDFIMITLNMYNQYGILWSQREPETSRIYLEKAEQIYKDFKMSGEIPVNITDLFQVNLVTRDIDTTWKLFEKMHTLTLYYLAQIFGTLKDALKSAVYCHWTLQRQLEFNDYEPIDWALNSATLSQFFMEKNGFKQARHHLAASSFILEKYEKILEEIHDRNEVYDAKVETFKHRGADVARCWAKYGLLLLLKSKERLLNHTDDIDTHCSLLTDLAKLQLTSESTVSVEDLQHLDFVGIEVGAHEYQITDQFALTLEDARKIFLNAQQWSLKAHEYYTLDTLASDYIEIVLDQTQLYLNLLFFDDNAENQAKLHKRRVNLLENILDKVSHQYYLRYCQQVWFELGRTYSDILDIKAEKLREIKGRPSPQALTKINNHVEKSIFHFTNFIDSYKDKMTGLLPEKLNEDIEKPILQAFFHIAALHSRHITLDKHKQLQNVESSLTNYRFVVDYCDKYPKAKELIPMEYGICKEMAALLPIKILKLKSQ